MPTTRKRHTITETDEVERALAPLRAEGVRVDFSELVVKGAESKLLEHHRNREDEARRSALREQFLERTRTGEGVDFDVLIDVHDHGWARDANG